MILIIGAGLAGLSLARTLQKHSIPFRIFDQAPSNRFQGFGLTLHAEAISVLLDMLQVDEAALRELVAVNRSTGYMPQTLCDAVTGQLHTNRPEAAFNAARLKDFRTNRERLWATIRGSIEIEFSHKLVNVQQRDDDVVAEFASGEKVEGRLLVAADGVHSFLRRTLHPDVVVEDWDGIFFNGTRKVSKAEFQSDYAPFMDDLAAKIGFYDNSLLAVTLYDVDTSNGSVSLSWGYSRRKRGDNDPLFVPYSAGKDKWRAALMPWDELEQLPPLTKPLSNIIANSKLREDHLIRHPLISHLIPLESLKTILRYRRVVFIGDSARSWSNHAGTAGNEAILDGVILGTLIVNGDGLENLYEHRYGQWQTAMTYNAQLSEALHKPREEWLRSADSNGVSDV